jgi:hypothetical protein
MHLCIETASQVKAARKRTAGPTNLNAVVAAVVNKRARPAPTVLCRVAVVLQRGEERLPLRSGGAHRVGLHAAARLWRPSLRLANG